MSKYGNQPGKFINLESLNEIRLYKMQTRGYGSVPELDEYVDAERLIR